MRKKGERVNTRRGTSGAVEGRKNAMADGGGRKGDGGRVGRKGRKNGMPAKRVRWEEERARRRRRRISTTK